MMSNQLICSDTDGVSLEPVVLKMGRGEVLGILTDNHRKLVLRSILPDGSADLSKQEVHMHFDNARQAQATFWALTHDFSKEIEPKEADANLLVLDSDD